MGLAALYAQVPRLDCSGRCALFCRGTIAMHQSELDRLVRALSNSRVGVVAVGHDEQVGVVAFNAGADVHLWHEQPDCPLLRGGRCLGYQVRPMICRLWGVVEGAECPWGCKATPRYLTPLEAQRLLLLSVGWTEADATRALEIVPESFIRRGWTDSVKLPTADGLRAISEIVIEEADVSRDEPGDADHAGKPTPGLRERKASHQHGAGH